MRYANIYKFDISNGPGIRVSLFTQGCPFHCDGCFNPETWDFKGGEKFTHETLNYLMCLCDKNYISGLSILGGEPFIENNLSELCDICMCFKQHFPNKSIWIWTGFEMETLLKLSKDKYISSILENVDVVIDGQFVKELKDLSLLWRGSSNQRMWYKENNKWIHD